MFNLAILTGRLTRDPEAKQTQNGKTMAKFTIAIDSNFRNADGSKGDSTFMDITAFNSQADVVLKFVHKGDLIGVQGRIESRKYINKDGIEVKTFGIMAERVDLMPKAVASSQPREEQSFDNIPPQDRNMFADFKDKQEKEEVLEADDDELPF